MNKFALLSAGLAAMIVPLLTATPAQADPKTFVSSTGSGTLCTRAAPCNNFLAAHNATDAGGEINCLDSGIISGNTTISKSITIDCAGLAATGVALFSVNAAGIVVMIRNLKIDGVFGTTLGIDFINGAALSVENCVIQNFTAAGGIGIRFWPSSGAQLVVSDTTINNNGTGLTGGGLIIQPTGSGTLDIVLNRVQVENNPIGVKADGSVSTGVIQVSIRDSVVMGSKAGSGVTAVTTAGQATTTVSISRSHITNNGTGVLSNGALAAVLLSNSTIQANGVALSSAAGGALFSYKNNDINNNGTPGSAPTVIAQN